MKITLCLSAPLWSLLPRIGEVAFISDELERTIVNENTLASSLVCQPRLKQDLTLFTTDVQNNICYLLN